MMMLTLAEAIEQDRLDEFVAQAEEQGVGPADRAQFEALVGTLTAPQPEYRTSRSRGDGSKRGT